MLLPRTLRPLRASPAPISTSLTRFTLPVRTRCLSISASTNLSSEDPTPPESEFSTSSEPDVPPTAEAGPQTEVTLPYFVGRNNLNNLGVYHKKKRGGNLTVTLVKNGEGDLRALKRDLKEALELKEGEVSLNSVTRQLVIRGKKKLQVLHFLHTMGF